MNPVCQSVIGRGIDGRRGYSFFHRKACFFSILFAAILIVKFASSTASSNEPDQEKANQLTAKELQASLMSYADLVSTVMGQIAFTFEGEGLPIKTRFSVQRDITYTVSSAITIAAEPNPMTGLLDMAVIISVGRMIYEQYWLPKHGPPMEILVKGYRTLEEKIWKIVSQVLTSEQEKELRAMIAQLRKEYPNQVDFVQLRFADFSALRAESPLASKVKSGGLLAPVADVTRQLEATQQLAERAMFLGTRLPLMTGAFMDGWLSLWLTNPEVNGVVGDVKVLSESTHALANLLDKLPAQLEQVGSAAVREAVDLIFLRACLFVIISVITFFSVKLIYQVALKRIESKRGDKS